MFIFACTSNTFYKLFTFKKLSKNRDYFNYINIKSEITYSNKNDL